MPHDTSLEIPAAATPQEEELRRLRQAGREIATDITLFRGTKATDATLKRTWIDTASTIAAQQKLPVHSADKRWLYDNYRLIQAAQRDTKEFAAAYRDSRTATISLTPDPVPLPYALGKAYLHAAADDVTEPTLVAFLHGFQQTHALKIAELWALKPALQLLLLERISLAATAGGPSLPVVINSLRRTGESEWKELVEEVSVIQRVLSQDPAGFFTQQDYASRDQYRSKVAELAKYSEFSERDIADAAVQLAAGSRAHRHRHIGYWLLDEGQAELRKAIDYRPPEAQRIRDFVLRWPQAYYLSGIEFLTLVLVFSLLAVLGSVGTIAAALLLLLIPVSVAAVDFMNNLTTFLLRPRALPKLDFSAGIPGEFSAMVAIPTLLLSENQVRQLVTDLEIRFLANRDPNLSFALVTDGPDSDRAQDDRDALVEICVGLIETLNRRYADGAHTPFYLFHRHRVYNESEGRWMGWERKRGKLLDLNQLLRGGFDSFPVKVGDLSVLPRIKYIITLDSDTQLPRDTAHKLIGTLAHPLHQAVINPVTKVVTAGYGILQPRIGVSIQSAASSRLASIYSGQTGFDIYTLAVSDVYQDLFGEGIFTGKGIYDVDALRTVIEHRFPENALLSHDLIEGAYARVGLVSDLELIDDYPSHFSAYSRRKHRWVRGDWQILRWLLPRVPDVTRQLIANPISLISRWKIIDNLRRSLFEPSAVALLVAGWLWLPPDAWYWTSAVLLLLLIPAYASLFFSLLRLPLRSPALFGWVRDTAAAFFKGHAITFLQLVFLLHQAMLSLDAITRSVLRVFVTKRRLLEWETAAEAEDARRRTATVDAYLAWSPLLALALAALLWFIRPQALPVAAPILVLWFSARLISAWLNTAPDVARHLQDEDIRFLHTAAVRTWRYFHEWSQAATNWLIPDNIREDGVQAQRLSPTNLGLLVNARIAAVHFGYLTLPEFVASTRQTLAQMRQLTKHRGHVLNWYDSQTLRPLAPHFVSTVDSGNLVACLWTLKQAALSFIADPPSMASLGSGMADIAGEISPQLGEHFRRAEWERSLPELEQFVLHADEPDNDDIRYWRAELLERMHQSRHWLQHGLTTELTSALHAIAADSDRLAAAMDFGFLFQRRKKVMSIGCDASTGHIEASSYDLLASESRIASFVAIAKGDLPQEAWFHLGRRHTLFEGQRVLVSWTGTMFEYLMPALWMKHYRHTIMQDSMEAVVRVQQRVGQRQQVPWGISESGCAAPSGGDYGYYAFGIPELAMKPSESEGSVISPYSTVLALVLDPVAALRNLRAMTSLNWFGRYGFYEAVDFRSGQPEVIRSWMAHHQGMSLLALCNLLFDNRIQEHFHADPRVQATELLLHERVPTAVAVEQDVAPVVPPQVAEAAASS